MSRAIWLLERINAKERPITDAEVKRFARHPAGPILPDSCVETRRLPADYGTGSEWRKAQPPVLALSATPKGKPCIGTVVRGQPMVFFGNHNYLLGEPEKFARGDETKCDSMRILGFRDRGLADPEPVVEVTTVWEHIVNHYPGSATAIYSGGQKYVTGVLSASRLQDESLVIQTWKNVVNPGAILRSGAPIDSKGSGGIGYRKFFLMPNGRLAGFYRDERFRACYVDDESLIDLRCEVVDVLETDDALWWVRVSNYDPRRRREGDYGLIKTGKEADQYGFRCTLGVDPLKNPYRSRLTEIGENRFAYIGETTRDGMECWVVGREEQPGFDRVSPLFRRGDDWLYWGAAGGHLCLMEIPRE